jgi:hypothetical protein
VLGLGFNKGDGNRLGISIDLYAQDIINPSLCPLAGLAFNNLNGARGLPSRRMSSSVQPRA